MWLWTRWSTLCASCRILWPLRWTVKLFPNCYCISSWIKGKNNFTFSPQTPSSSLSFFFPITHYLLLFLPALLYLFPYIFHSFPLTHFASLPKPLIFFVSYFFFYYLFSCLIFFSISSCYYFLFPMLYSFFYCKFPP